MKLAIVSGGFDPIHSGHIDNIKLGLKVADKVVILLNSDVWLTAKKGGYFQDWDTRCAIVRSIEGVWAVHPVDDGDGTVCKGIAKLHSKYINEHDLFFVKGGDRIPANTPEFDLCIELNIPMIFGGKKVDSSTNALDRWAKMCGGDSKKLTSMSLKTKVVENESDG